jgi:hypothetical protein
MTSANPHSSSYKYFTVCYFDVAQNFKATQILQAIEAINHSSYRCLITRRNQLEEDKTNYFCFVMFNEKIDGITDSDSRAFIINGHQPDIEGFNDPAVIEAQTYYVRDNNAEILVDQISERTSASTAATVANGH